ncbi:MAG: hypothetical protein CVU05_06150 [Bacteroidetes bacterium HGW-Bacteroidetes-21]|jgi:RNA polymerase sigma-70 factor (ECF subfamily)|nr:MAG: hypothetical protein CVU05_06150 [Bacteroidetes bacterium HGW-Bacteroidetes-21]
MADKKQIEFMELYKPIHDSFVRFCAARSYGIIETEDLVSETIVQAYSGFEKLREKKAFLSFLFSIASNIIKNALRKKKNVEMVYHLDHQLEDKSHATLDAKADIELLYKALTRLPDLQKEAIILFEISGFSIQEIADMQKSGISSVKQRLKRGREKLSELLGCNEISAESLSKKSTILMNLFF